MTRAHAILLLLISVSPALGVSLEEAFRTAAQKNERIAEQRERVTQADERISQVIGGVLPQISASGGYTLQPLHPDTNFQSFFPQTQTIAQLTVNQAVFRGLREFAGLRKFRRLHSSELANQQGAMVQLFQDVAANYLNILSLEKDLGNLNEQAEVYSERAKQMKARLSRGESSQSEALLAESAEASLLAEIQLVQGQLEATREMFGFLTGLPADSRLEDPDALHGKKQLPSLEECLKRVGERPDIKAATDRLIAAEEGVSMAWGAHLPSIDVVGNYYLTRPSPMEPIKWDVGVRLSIPLFAGGTTSALVREAISQKAGADLELQRLRRQATQEIRSLHKRLEARLGHLTRLKKSVELSRRNVQVLQKEFRRGLTRNIDVHLALSESRGAIRGYDQARFAAQVEFFQLQAAAALIPVQMKGAVK